MKKIILLLLPILFYLTQAKAQTSVYYPFPDSNAVWEVEYGGLECNRCESYQNNFDGDTIINSIHYHKIHKQGAAFYPGGADSYCTNIFWHSINEYFCAIRYDSTQKKVFMVPYDSLNEYIIYDFTLNVGDYFHGYLLGYAEYNLYNDSLQVTSIDSALVGSAYRKQWHFEGGTNPVIEGVGATSGVVEVMGFFEQGGQLICFNQNGVPLYPDTNTICILPTSISEINKTNEEVILSPNPATDKLYINSSGLTGNSTIIIYNLLGETIYTMDTNGKSRTYGINCKPFPSGIYFLQLKTENGSAVRRFVKE